MRRGRCNSIPAKLDSSGRKVREGIAMLRLRARSVSRPLQSCLLALAIAVVGFGLQAKLSLYQDAPGGSPSLSSMAKLSTEESSQRATLIETHQQSAPSLPALAALAALTTFFAARFGSGISFIREAMQPIASSRARYYGPIVALQRRPPPSLA
jgi:hypothetical protein